MSAPDVVANMSRGWNRDPAGVAVGGATGVSAALWCGEGPAIHDVEGPPDPINYVVAVNQCAFRSAMFIDGRGLYDKVVLPGSVQLVRPGERPAARIHGRFETLHVYVPNVFLTGCLAGEGVDATTLELCDPGATTSDPAIQLLALEMRAEMAEARNLSRLRIDSAGLALVVRLLCRHSNFGDSRTTPFNARGGLAPWQVRRCTEYLRDHMAADVALSTLAAIANLSPFHFARMFKKTVGVPPHRYQLLLRLERAKELLLTSEMSVLEIALAVGYDAPQTLARLFRREMGVTPSAWRRERRS